MLCQKFYFRRHDTFVDYKFKSKHVDKCAKKYPFGKNYDHVSAAPRFTSFQEV